MITNLEGSKLKIEIKYPKVLFNNDNVVLDVYIPQDYTGNINIDTVSADVDISGLDLNDFKCKTVSGDLRIESIGSDNLTLHTTSGDVDIVDFSGNLEADSVSGDIDVERCSSVAFVIPTQDIYNGMGGNNLAEQKNWSVVTENWKEGSTASLTLYTKKDYETLDIQFDLWVFVNGLNEAVDVEILVSPLESSSEPEFIKIKLNNLEENKMKYYDKT